MTSACSLSARSRRIPPSSSAQLGLPPSSLNSRTRPTSFLVDAPPILNLSDTMTLSARVDALVVVVRLPLLKHSTLHELHRVLGAAPATKLGFVVTGTATSDTYGGYGYGYGHSQPSKPQRCGRRAFERIAETSSTQMKPALRYDRTTFPRRFFGPPASALRLHLGAGHLRSGSPAGDYPPPRSSVASNNDVAY